MLQSRPTVINVGVPLFRDALLVQGVAVTHLDWQPPAGGDLNLAHALDRVGRIPQVDDANQEAIRRVVAGQPVLVGMGLAGEVIPNMSPTTILHAGPPITWERMSGPLRGAVLGAIVLEGLAPGLDEAERLAASGGVTFAPCHEHDAVGPMAGVTSYSMPVFIVENRPFGNRAYCSVNEGLGKVLRYGANGPEVLARLRWMRETLYPLLRSAIEASGGIDLKVLIAQALHMGDEGHNRNKAGTSLTIRALLPHLMGLDVARDRLAEALAFLNGNDHFFLNLTMPAMKATLDAAHSIPFSTMVTTMARNGTEFGIRVSGLPGRWFTGPAQQIKGLLFPGYSEDDCNPDIGDSAITETGGIGGFVMAGAPAIVQFVGGTPADALQYSAAMYEITLGENSAYTIPPLGFRGSPTGIDIRKVVETGLLPIINTGIAHRQPGVGMVGAGIVRPPSDCFDKALLAFVDSYCSKP